MSESAFDAFALPASVAAPRVAVLGEGSTPFRHVVANPAWVDWVTDTLKGVRDALAARPAGEVARVLGGVGARFLDPDDALRARALELLPGTSGLAPEMAAAVLDGMARDWTEERLLGLVRAELGSEWVLDGFVRRGDPAGSVGGAMAVGPALCVQIVAGGVPGVGVSALLRSLLLKGPTLLKPGRADVVLPVLFARALAEADAALSDALAVVYWPGGLTAVEDAALARADVVTAYGSDETVAALRARTPVTARFVAYHHRVSIGIVGRDATRGDALRKTAAVVAEAVAMFDRRGCVSPQIVFVEGDAAAFASALAEALEALEGRLPSGSLDAAERSALHQLRGTAELEAGAGGVTIFHGGAAPWTVIVESEDGAGLGACPGRAVMVRAVSDVGGVAELVAPLAEHLQTVGVAGLGERTAAVAAALGRLGACRVVPFGSVAFPPPWWHHDGGGPLLDLVRWVDLEGG